MATASLRDGIRLLCRAAGPGPAGVSDADLLDRFARHRDEAAFELLVWRHGALVLGTCRRLLRDAHEAEDAVQACFLVLARRAASVGRRGSVGGWLHRVAFRMALLAKARRAKFDARRRPLDDDGPRPPIPTRRPRPNGARPAALSTRKWIASRPATECRSSSAVSKAGRTPTWPATWAARSGRSSP